VTYLLEREEVMEKLFLFLTKDYYWIEEKDDDFIIHKVDVDDTKGMRRKSIH
jgi:hypothetical protein